MQPVNTKSLLAFAFDQMEKLDKDDITPEKACAQAKLIGQASNLLNYELKRTLVQVKMCEIRKEQDVRLREIESKSFDDDTIRIINNK